MGLQRQHDLVEYRDLDKNIEISIFRCFRCDTLIPPRPDPACTKCLQELAEWDRLDP